MLLLSCHTEAPSLSWNVKMATLRLRREFSKALLATPALCKCGLPCSRSFFTLTRNGRRAVVPSRVLKVARYYEKPKEKKGPSASSWVFLAGATTGLLIGAVGYFGMVNDKISMKFLLFMI